MTRDGNIQLRANVTIHTNDGTLLTHQRIRLLEAIEVHGSLSQAAKKLPLSYKAAWEAIEHMNQMLEFPLVERKVGGRKGGGTELTTDGKRFLAMYHAIENQCQKSIAELVDYINAGGTSLSFRYLLNRHELNSLSQSARTTQMEAGNADA